VESLSVLKLDATIPAEPSANGPDAGFLAHELHEGLYAIR